MKVISRASALAKCQVKEAIETLENSLIQSYQFETTYVESFGDIYKSISLMDGQAPADLFTRELDQGLREGTADFAVHSAKDLNLPLEPDIELYALLPAADKTDSLVSRAGALWTLASLPPGAKIGTSSVLRKAEILNIRPDLQVESIRGTIEERIRQVDRGDFEAVICATCALKRLGLQNRISEVLTFSTHPLQGHLAITGLRGREDLEKLWRPLDIRRSWGTVSMVGAGPGDPELLTLKAKRVLADADIIFNDSLANPVILDGLKGEIVFVGKRKDYHGAKQAQINELLYQAALQGKKTVRLKGGDPMIFGRATEEMDYLEQRLVELEVVPGISSAFAAAAYTQIPLTEREVSASVSFCLGYPEEKIQTPGTDSLVYFMGASTLPQILSKNLAAGRQPNTPVALIHNASLPDQKIWISTLGELSTQVPVGEISPYPAPLLIFIGPVVRSGRLSNWFQNRPLIWYTGTSIDHFSRKARVIHKPLIEIKNLEDYTETDTLIRGLKEFRWVIFTSRHTVEHFFRRMGELGLDSRAFYGLKIGAVGRSTAKELLSQGIRADLVPSLESSVGLVAAFKEIFPAGSLDGTRVLLPSSDQALSVIFDGLTALGAVVRRLELYRNLPLESHPEVSLELLDEVVLTSPSTAKTFHHFYPVIPKDLKLTPMGDQTRQALINLFPEHTISPSLLNPSEGTHR